MFSAQMMPTIHLTFKLFYLTPKVVWTWSCYQLQWENDNSQYQHFIGISINSSIIIVACTVITAKPQHN